MGGSRSGGSGGAVEVDVIRVDAVDAPDGEAMVFRPAGPLDRISFLALRREVADGSAAGGAVVVDLTGVTSVSTELLPDLPATLEWASELPVTLADTAGLLHGSGTATQHPAITHSTLADAVSRSHSVKPRLRAVADFPADLSSAGRARRFISALCREWGLDGLELDASIVVSELVENAVRHCRSSCSVGIELGHRLLAIGVADSGYAAPQLLHPGPGQVGGRGLMLTDTLCRRWGYREVLRGKVVWAVLTLPADQPRQTRESDPVLRQVP